MDIQYQVYPPSNSTWLQLLVFSLGSGYHFMALTLKHCYSVILCFLSGFFVVVGFCFFFNAVFSHGKPSQIETNLKVAI